MSRAGYLLDPNVVSELRRPLRPQKLNELINKQPVTSLYISVLTVGELRRGVIQLKRREEIRSATLASWIDDVVTFYSGRILPVDIDTAIQWAKISAGRTLPAIDTLLAATAIVHDLTLVTRNTRDVEDTGVRLLNPWQP